MPFVVQDTQMPAMINAAPMTDAEFAAFCAEHPDLKFETTAEGQILIMPPAFSLTGLRNAKICRQLDAWAESDGSGLALDSSAGFVLPNGARRSPDASWVLKSRVRELTPTARRGFWHLCPDFVIELRSETDRLKALRAKMREYLEQGAQLGWLIDPDSRTVEIHRAGSAEPELRANADSVEGEGPVAGFRLELARVWDPLAD